MELPIALQPLDDHNLELQSNVHPQDWQNPTPKRPYHLVVIGAGTAGLVTAAGAAGLGARVALIERELMGGDCLNVGCVPSKALISSARVAATLRRSEKFGVTSAESSSANVPDVDFAKVMQRMREKRASISPADSAKRFQDLGVDVFFGDAQFVGDGKIQIGTNTESNREPKDRSQEIEYRRAVIATGARASAPSIPGLEDVNYLTNESLFSLTELPKRFGIVGSGPIGAEMAQTFSNLGSDVYLFEREGRILTKEDPDAAMVVQESLERDGVNLVLNGRDMRVSQAGEAIRISVNVNGEQRDTDVDQLLIAVGRAPNVDSLNLESIGVRYDRDGVDVDDNLRTTNPKVFAAGDVCSKYKFTHAADFLARTVIQNALFALGPFGKKRASDLIIPWATYTSPELAHVGLSEQAAKDQGVEVDCYLQQMSRVDRAMIEGADQGFVKVLTKKGSDKIVGATIVAENAGDMISEITLAMTQKVGLGKIASTIHPYPTQTEAIRKLGDQFNRTKLTSFSKKLLNLLRQINVGA